MKFYQTKKFQDIMRRIDLAARRARVRYALEGGNAVDMFANPPVTKDIDILVSGAARRFLDFVDEMSRQAFRLRESYGDEDEGFALLFFVCRKTRVQVDVKWSLYDSLHLLAVRTAVILNGVPVARPELLICLKTQAYSDRRAPRDAAAVKSMWSTLRKNIDMPWLMQKLREIGMLGVFLSLIHPRK